MATIRAATVFADVARNVTAFVREAVVGMPKLGGPACSDAPALPRSTVRRAHSALVRGGWLAGGALEPVATDRQRVRRMQTEVASEVYRQTLGLLLPRGSCECSVCLMSMDATA